MPADDSKQDKILERLEALTEKVQRLERDRLSYFGVFVTVIIALLAAWVATLLSALLIVPKS